jgi:hypothetical protein
MPVVSGAVVISAAVITGGAFFERRAIPPQPLGCAGPPSGPGPAPPAVGSGARVWARLLPVCLVVPAWYGLR